MFTYSSPAPLTDSSEDKLNLKSRTDEFMPIGRELTDFSEDKLNLKSFADDLASLVVSQLPHPTNEHSKVIALDSGWGTGKTSFINMWTKKLGTDPKFFCLIYKAWEHDDSSDALVPIIHALLSQCPRRRIITHICLKLLAIPEYISIIIGIAVGIVLFIIGVYILKVDPNEFGVLLTAVSVAMVLVKVMTNRFCIDYFARQKHKVLFEKLISGIRGEHNYLLIFIDELDRCRPTFAIETLEVVKHFFNIPNVVFVFSLDMEQLSKSIKTVYGDIDSAGYLQRFFDYRISLPKPSTLGKFLKDRLEISETGFEIELLIELAKKFSISLRTLNVICVVYNQFKTYTLSSPNQYLWFGIYRVIFFKIYLAFIALACSYPEKYQSLLRNGTSEELGKEIFGLIVDRDTEEIANIYTKESANFTMYTVFQSDHSGLKESFCAYQSKVDSSLRLWQYIDINIQNSWMKAKETETILTR